MFCIKCGKEFPDGSVACPHCGAPVANELPVTPAVAPAASASSNSYDIVGFLTDFLKRPIEACSSRENAQNVLLGLTFPVAYAVLEFIYDLINSYSIGAAVGYFFCEIIAIASLIGFAFLLANPFKVKSTDIISKASFIGLLYFPKVVLRLVAFLNTKLLNVMDNPIFSISGILTDAALFFMMIAIFDNALEKKQPNGDKKTALLYTICVYALYSLVHYALTWGLIKIMY
ncbi:MAG: zinc ribbon domain-containing protein [Clostridiales bacterium]|nr:zinc ribbon domain-containing protein [Clostridiales bacterium]